MISFPSISLSAHVPSFLQRRPQTAISIAPVKVYDTEAATDQRLRALKHLLKLNHVKHGITFPKVHCYNQLPHLLGSVYCFGSSKEQLEKAFETESCKLSEWTSSPSEVTVNEWRDFLGDKRFSRAYIDFFEDELIAMDYDWHKVLESYLYAGSAPLFHCLISGFSHPLIHLSYAYEFSSRELAIEALSLVATSYEKHLHDYLQAPSFLLPSSWSSESIQEILKRVMNDPRFDRLCDTRSNNKSNNDMERLFTQKRDLVQEYWNALSMKDALALLEESQMISATLLATTTTASFNHHVSHSVSLAQTLITSHAVRVLLPIIPPHLQTSLIRQWWLFALGTYICQLRPIVDMEAVSNYDTQGRSWKSLTCDVIGGRWASDAYFLKAFRALMTAAQTWEESSDYYLKAAAKLCDHFSAWEGLEVSSASITV